MPQTKTRPTGPAKNPSVSIRYSPSAIRQLDQLAEILGGCGRRVAVEMAIADIVKLLALGKLPPESSFYRIQSLVERRGDAE